MQILVTGGRGAVGTHLVAELKRRGHHVTVADLSHAAPDGDYVRCDIASYRQLERIWKGGGWTHGYSGEARRPDVVYHLAAEFGRWNGEDYYEQLWRTNVVGTKNLLRLQAEYGFRTIYFSSSEVYGDWNDIMREDVMDEHAVRQLNDYAISKWVNEQQVMNSADQDGTESVRVRLFNTYGPGEHYTPFRSVVAVFCYRLLHGLPIRVHRGHERTSTFISDCVSALANISDRFVPGRVYNIGGTVHHDIEELAGLICRHIGGVPEHLLEYRDAEPFTTRKKVVDTTLAQRELDLAETVPLDEGIRRTVEWMRNVYAPTSHL